MKTINKVGRFLGIISSFVIIIALFLPSVDRDYMDIRYSTLTVFESNRVGGVIIIIIAIAGCYAAFKGSGLATSIAGIASLAANIFFAARFESADPVVRALKRIDLGLVTQGLGFWIAIFGSLVLLGSGIMLSKQN